MANQKRAEKVNELRRLEGVLAGTSRHHRLGYIRDRIEGEREKRWQSLNVADSSGLL